MDAYIEKYHSRVNWKYATMLHLIAECIARSNGHC